MRQRAKTVYHSLLNLKKRKKGFMHAIEAVLAVFLLMFYAGNILKTPQYMKTYESEILVRDLTEQTMGLLTSLDAKNLLGEAIFSCDFQLLTKVLQNMLPEQANFDYTVTMMQPFTVRETSGKYTRLNWPITVSVDFPVAADRNSITLKDKDGNRLTPFQVSWPWMRHHITMYYTSTSGNWEKNISVYLRSCDSFTAKGTLFDESTNPCTPIEGVEDIFEFEPYDTNEDGYLEYPDKNSVRVYLNNWYDPRWRFRVKMYVRGVSGTPAPANVSLELNLKELIDRQQIAPTMGIDLNSTIITDKWGVPVNRQYISYAPDCTAGVDCHITLYNKGKHGADITNYEYKLNLLWEIPENVYKNETKEYYLYFTTFDLEPSSNQCEIYNSGGRSSNITYYNCKQPRATCIDNDCCIEGKCSISDCNLEEHNTVRFNEEVISGWCPKVKSSTDIPETFNAAATYGAIEFYEDQDYREMPLEITNWLDGRVADEKNKYLGVTVRRKVVSTEYVTNFAAGPEDPSVYPVWKFQLDISAEQINTTVEVGASVIGMEILEYLNEEGFPESMHSCQYLMETAHIPCITVENLNHKGEGILGYEDTGKFVDYPEDRNFDANNPGDCDDDKDFCCESHADCNGGQTKCDYYVELGGTGCEFGCFEKDSNKPCDGDEDGTADFTSGCRCKHVPNTFATKGDDTSIYFCSVTNKTGDSPSSDKDPQDSFLITVTVPKEIKKGTIKKKNKIKNIRLNVPLVEMLDMSILSNSLSELKDGDFICPGMADKDVIGDMPGVKKIDSRIVMLNSGETLDAVKQRSDLAQAVFPLYPSSYGKVRFHLPYLESPDSTHRAGGSSYEVKKEIYIYYSLGTDKVAIDPPESPFCGSKDDKRKNCGRHGLHFLRGGLEHAPRGDLSWIDTLQPSEEKEYFAFYSVGTHKSMVTGDSDLIVNTTDQCDDCFAGEACNERMCTNGKDDDNDGDTDEIIIKGVKNIENSYINWGFALNRQTSCPLDTISETAAQRIPQENCPIRVIESKNDDERMILVDNLKPFNDFVSVFNLYNPGQTNYNDYSTSESRSQCTRSSQFPCEGVHINDGSTRKEMHILESGPVKTRVEIINDFFDFYVINYYTFYSQSPFWKQTKIILPEFDLNVNKVSSPIYHSFIRYGFDGLWSKYSTGFANDIHHNTTPVDINALATVHNFDQAKWFLYWNETCCINANCTGTPCGLFTVFYKNHPYDTAYVHRKARQSDSFLKSLPYSFAFHPNIEIYPALTETRFQSYGALLDSDPIEGEHLYEMINHQPLDVEFYNTIPLHGGTTMIERDVPSAVSTGTASYVITTNGRKLGYAWLRFHLWYG